MDALHERAQLELADLKRQKKRLVVSTSTLAETQSLLLRRETPQFGHMYLDALLRSSDLINPSTDDYLQAHALLKRFSDQRISLYDALPCCRTP